MPALVFPSAEALRAALGARLIPPGVTERGAQFLQEDDGRLVVVPQARLSRDVSAALRAVGVRARRGGLAATADTREVACWAEIIAPRWVGEDSLDTRLALFVLNDGEALLSLAGELLRLGCDRQELALCDGEPGGFLRAVAPPYYTVARALEGTALEGEGTGLEGVARLFLPVEGKGDRVFCEAGFEQALLGQVEPPAQGLLLLGGDGHFVWISDVEFQDIYQLLSVKVPKAQALEAQPLDERIEVHLALVEGAREEAATLWVISEQALERVDALVTQLPEDEASRLMVAIIEREGKRVVLLRARMDGRPPPALDLSGEACAPFLGVDNLYLPNDAVFEPPLRPGALREDLAPDPDELTFVTRWGGGRSEYRVERVAAAAFEPLASWVDYVIEGGVAQLSSWVRSATFDLAPFISTGLEWSEKPAQEDAPRSDEKKQERQRPSEREATAEEAEPPQKLVLSAMTTKGLSFAPVATLKLSEAGTELAQLEERWVNLDVSAEEEERSPLWVQMAQLNARLSRERDAGLCWTRALWQSEGQAAEALAHAWAESEELLADSAAVDLLSLTSPNPGQVRGVAAWLHAADTCAELQIAPELLQRASRWIHEHGARLDVRSLWLAQLALARLSGGDQLLLARARDRVLLRLRRGLSLQQDVPSFLRRGAGEQGRLAGETLVAELEGLFTTYTRTKRTRTAVEAPEPQTRAYVQLVFAFGFARLGEGERATDLMGAARGVLDLEDEIHGFLCDAFCARVEQALEGLSSLSALPPAINARLNGLPRFSRYKVDRLRQASSILEPQERLDPVVGFQRNEVDPRGAEFGPLRELTDPEAIATAIAALMHHACASEPVERARIFDGAMDFFPHLQEGQVVPLLQQIVGGVDDMAPTSRFEILEEALMVSGLFRREELARTITAGLLKLLRLPGVKHLELMVGALGRMLHSLRRAGLTELSPTLLGEVERLAQGDEVTALLVRMELAAGLADLGENRRGEALLVGGQKAADKARLAPADQMRFTRALVEASSHLPLSTAVGGIRTLAKRLSSVSDSFNTNSHFCLSVIQFMEALVLGLASEALLIDERGRQLLDEDEYGVRRRIHLDQIVKVDRS
ncbi:MAG: hypothetical protein JRH20_23945 [Deltaproteobacteria bacterium]|nr:hypothetical protein [Deltaproteobacteria bacterium]